MAIDNIQPVHAINNYFWSRIGDAGDKILLRNNYKTPGMAQGLIPIVPVKETADLYEIIQAQPGTESLPYIVYTWSRVNRDSEWYLEEHQIAYSIRTADSAKMGQIIKAFNIEFRDYDRAAMRVNNYIQHGSSSNLKRFDFKYISVTQLGAEMPADTESGEDEAIVVITATFADNITSGYSFILP